MTQQLILNIFEFSDNVSFEDAQFNFWVTFKKRGFRSLASFENTHFDSVSFQNASFSSVANFNGTQFKGMVFLDECYLPDTLYFSHVQTLREIDFTYALTDSVADRKRCVIDLYGTDLSKIKFDYSRFKILVDTAKYRRRQLSNMYEKVLKMQEDQGFLDGYEVVDKEYRHFKLTYEKAGMDYLVGTLGSWSQRVWWDYGYRKERIFVWTFSLFGFFFFVNHLLFPYLNRKIYHIENIYEQDKEGNSLKTAVFSFRRLFSIRNVFKALFYSCLLFFGLRLGVDRIQFKYYWGATYLLAQYIVGLICLAYLANFIIMS